MNREYISVKEAADVIGVSPKTMNRWLNEGRVLGKQINHTWFVERDFMDKIDYKSPSKSQY